MTQTISTPSHEQLSQWRQGFHSHPETAFEEHETSARIAQILREQGLEPITGLGGGTGIVAVLQGKRGAGPSIGLRADIDALDIHEATGHSYASTNEGKMHACGHDGHTTMLLGAASALAKNPDFAGTVYFIFQPAEENEGGARVMVEEGLFDRFNMDAVYALHNWPGLPVGEAAVHDTAVMAAFDIFDLELTGVGCHAAMPHMGKDVILAASQLVTQLQGLVSREAPAHQPAVLSITSIHAGDTYNVLPKSIKLKGTLRCFDQTLREQLQQRFREVVASICQLHGLESELDYQPRYPATINVPEHAEKCVQALQATAGIKNIHRNLPPSMASEDFSFMLMNCPGAYIWLGNGTDSAPLHSPFYDFNDNLLPIGVQYLLNLVQVATGSNT